MLSGVLGVNPAQLAAILTWLGPDTPDDATLGELRKQVAALATDAVRVPDCTGLTAAWCPVHGDCTCDRESDDWDEVDCPLHNQLSSHPRRSEP